MSGVSVAKKNGGQTSAIFANDTRWRPNSQILHRRDRSNSRVTETARPAGVLLSGPTWSGRDQTGLQARSEIGVGWKIGVTWPRKRSFKTAATELGYYSQNYLFGLVYDMIYQFLGMEAKNHKFGMSCQLCHPSMAPGDADIQPRNASRIHTCHLFMS